MPLLALCLAGIAARNRLVRRCFRAQIPELKPQACRLAHAIETATQLRCRQWSPILIDYQPHRPYGMHTLAFAGLGQQVSKLTCHAYAQLRARLCLRQFERAIPNVRLLHPKHVGRSLTREVREVYGVAKRLIGYRPER